MLRSDWFREANRRSMIDFFTKKLDEEVNQLAKTPSVDNLNYQTAVSRANIAWYKTLLHIADPKQYKVNPIGNRVKEPLTAREYEEWRKQTVDKYVYAPPHPDPVTATFIHQIINNGVHYVAK